MKKYKYFLITIVIIMIIPILYKMNIKHQETAYIVNEYTIKEVFNIKNKKHIYDYVIYKDNHIYSYTIENRANKRNKLIKEIKDYKEGDIICILPIYKNKKEEDLYCRKNNIQVSKEVLKNDKNYQKILKKVKKYNIQNLEEDDTKKTYKNITYYPNNLLEDEKIIIWDYKGIVLLTQEDKQYQQFLKNDLYDNIMSTMTSRYYVLFENTSVNGIQKIHTYDLLKNKYEVVELKEKEVISKNSYINGVINDLIYVTDKEKKKQYTINISKKAVKEVGNEELGFVKYTNNQKTIMRITDFLAKEQYFQNEFMENEDITSSKELREEDNYDYFKEEDTFYKEMKNANKVELFTLEGVEEWFLSKGELLLRKEDELYLYSDQEGLRKIVEYNELKYNHSNIYNIWK